MPVQAPTKYELLINLKTAKALGLAVPQSWLGLSEQFSRFDKWNVCRV
jgi:putative ABC transport system substrate-binding protein